MQKSKIYQISCVFCVVCSWHTNGGLKLKLIYFNVRLIISNKGLLYNAE